MTKEKSLKCSIFDGAAWSGMVGFGETYLHAFAVALKATNSQIAALASWPQFLGSLSQLIGANLSDRSVSRKKVITRGVMVQAVSWLPIILLPFLFRGSVPLLILFASVYWIAGMIIGPAWASLMGDLVPEKERGSYFGTRNKIIWFFLFLSVLGAGFVLSMFEGMSLPKAALYGFATIFSVALVARLISLYFLNRMDDPQHDTGKEHYFSIWSFMRIMGKNNFGLFVLYVCLMNFATQIAGPFFIVFILRDLDLSYLTFTVLQMTLVVGTFVFMPIWGRYGDMYGNRALLRATGLIIPFLPMLWLISTDVYFLVFVQFLSGFAWAGFNLSAFNFIYDAVSPPKRARCVAYFNVLVGSGIFLGAMLGALLTRLITDPWIFVSNLQIIFFVSGIIRLAVSLVMLPRIKEVRRVHRIGGLMLLWHVAGEPRKSLAGLRSLLIHRKK